MDPNLKKYQDIYSKPNSAPWTYSQIPEELTDLIKNKILSSPGKVLEIGCGEGHQSIFLAKEGFNVTAIDESKNAIKFAKQNAVNQKVKVKFKVQEYRQIESYKEKFDFIFDWRFLHQLTDEIERDEYLKHISNLLKPMGKYLSVAFSGDFEFMGVGKLRKSPVGIEIYFSTLRESEKLIKRHLKILDSKIITVPQKPNLNIKSNYILAQKIY